MSRLGELNHRDHAATDGNMGPLLQIALPLCMLRSTFVSIVVATCLVMAGLAFDRSGDAPLVSLDVHKWGAKDATVVSGLPVQRRGAVALQLDSSGRGVVEFNIDGMQLAKSPVLHVDFVGRPDVLALVVGWRRHSTANDMHSQQVGFSPGSDLWLNLSDHPEWSGTASSMALILLGPPGGEVALRSIELKPLAFPQTLFLTLADWTMFVPWRHSSINSNLGVFDVGGQPFSTVVFAVLSVLAMLVYSASIVALRRQPQFDWRVLGAIFVVYWVALDSLWQYKLLRQTEVTERTFAGKTTHEKRLASDDSALYEFINSARDAISEPDARLFVVSGSDFSGMRGAYFAYPQNVYWERHATSLPSSDKINAGDFVLLLHPVRAGYDKSTGVLRYGDEMSLNTELMLSNNIGALFKVF